MRKTETIQKQIAIFLLFVFTISIAPKVLFHNALANHKDASACQHANNAFCLHQQNYNCHFDDLVVTVPYLLPQASSINFIDHRFAKETSLFYQTYQQQYLQHKENRGPPSI